MGLSVQWVSERECIATFSGNIPTTEAIRNANLYSIEASNDTEMTIYDSEPSPVAGVTTLSVGPACLPLTTYTIKFANEVSTTEFPVDIFPAESPEWSHGLLDSLTEAFGEAIQRYSGRPQTLVVSDYVHGDGALFVESTLGFPPSGEVFIDNRKYSYESKTAMSLRGFVPIDFSLNQIAPKVLVTVNVRAIKPN